MSVERRIAIGTVAALLCGGAVAAGAAAGRWAVGDGADGYNRAYAWQEPVADRLWERQSASTASSVTPR